MNANVYVARFVVSGGDAAPDIPPTAVDKGFEPKHCLEHTAALTRAIATSEVYTKMVLNIREEFCTTSHESPTLPASASAFGGLSPGFAAVIVISAVVGAVLVVVMLLWRWNCLYQHVENGSSPSPVLEEEIAVSAPPQEDSSMQQEMQEQQRCIAEATIDDDDSMKPHQNECSFSPPLHTSYVLSKI